MRVTLSLATASRAIVILWSFSWLCVGLLIAPGITFLDRSSTRATSMTPSSKSVRMSTIDSPLDFSCSFTQFLNVFLWISTHWELLAAVSRVTCPFCVTFAILAAESEYPFECTIKSTKPWSLHPKIEIRNYGYSGVTQRHPPAVCIIVQLSFIKPSNWQIIVPNEYTNELKIFPKFTIDRLKNYKSLSKYFLPPPERDFVYKVCELLYARGTCLHLYY